MTKTMEVSLPSVLTKCWHYISVVNLKKVSFHLHIKFQSGLEKSNV